MVGSLVKRSTPIVESRPWLRTSKQKDEPRSNVRMHAVRKVASVAPER
jgi:hypothetical protein